MYAPKREFSWSLAVLLSAFCLSVLGEPASDPVAKAKQKYEELIQRNTLRLLEDAKKLQKEYLEALKTEMKRVAGNTVKVAALQRHHDKVAADIGLSLKKTDPFAKEFMARADSIVKSKRERDIKTTQAYIKHLDKKKEEARAAEDTKTSMRFRREQERAESLLADLKDTSKPIAPPPEPEEPKLKLPKGAVFIATFDSRRKSRTREGDTIIDLSGNGNDLSVTGAKFVPGKAGDCIQLSNGVAAVCEHDNVLSFRKDQAYTLSLWVKPERTHGRVQTVISKSRGKGNWYGVWIIGGKWCFGAQGGNINGGVVTGEWQHIVIAQVPAMNARFLVVDGKLAGKGRPFKSNGTGEFIVGSWTREPFEGKIDEIVLFNRALSIQEALLLQKMGSEGQLLKK